MILKLVLIGGICILLTCFEIPNWDSKVSNDSTSEDWLCHRDKDLYPEDKTVDEHVDETNCNRRWIKSFYKTSTTKADTLATIE